MLKKSVKIIKARKNISSNIKSKHVAPYHEAAQRGVAFGGISA